MGHPFRFLLSTAYQQKPGFELAPDRRGAGNPEPADLHLPYLWPVSLLPLPPPRRI